VTFTALIAEGEATTPKEGAQAPFWANPLFMIAIFGLFFLVVMLPAQRRKKREALQMMEKLKPGTKVITSSGIVGSIVKIKDGGTEVIIRTEDTKLCVLKTTITTVVGEETAEAKS
jgi:preprotein translocase subunit YajC